MAFADFDAENIPVGIDTSEQHQDRVNRVAFRGYSQRVADGLNAESDIIAAVFDRLPAATYTALRAFFDPLGAHTVFTWTPPGTAVVKKWTVVANSRRIRHRKGTAKTVTYNFQQEFDLG